MDKKHNWLIRETEFPQNNMNHKETVFTIGNGYFSSRGSYEEGYPGENATTFVHGVFNDVPVFQTELVNFPSWFALRVFLEDEEFTLSTGQILDYHRELDMANGLLTRRVTWISPEGRQATIQFERFMNMADVHHAALRFSIFEVKFAGQIHFHAPIPGFVCNERYRHWGHVDQGFSDRGFPYLEIETLQTKIRAGIAQSINIESNHTVDYQNWNAKWVPTQVMTIPVTPGEKIEGTKHCVIYTNEDVTDPIKTAKETALAYRQVGFNQALNANNEIWNKLWESSNVTIVGDDRADRALRYNLFQVLVAAPRHSDKVSIGAKTLSGYGYRGHVFWDTEIFILPFLIFTQPKIAKNLLMYRYHTLPGARAKANAQGFKGAMFAWESAATGEEVTPKWVTGPDGELIRIWCGDIEQHITADVVYAINQYWQATGDDGFMEDYGAEIVFSAAQFFASRLEWSPDNQSYHIRDVIGPDEYHEHVDDNAFTNLMAKWVLNYSIQVTDWMKEKAPEKLESLLSILKTTEDEINSWREMGLKIHINRDSEGIIEQFEGYFDLEFLDQKELEPRKQSLQSLFGIEGVQAYQFIKQPDVVMALFLLKEYFQRDQIINNMNYYTPRTDLTYGSSLGPSVQATLLARYGDVEEARELFNATLLTDLEDNRGNTEEGIHAASAGAVWQVLVLGFAGLEIKNGKVSINPRLPSGWTKISFQINWKGQKIPFDIIQ